MTQRQRDVVRHALIPPRGEKIETRKLRAIAGETPITAGFVESMTDSDRALAASAMTDLLSIARSGRAL